MYTKQEISKQKQAFWTAFGRYMKPILSADGEVISWLNYKTGNKFIQFRMDVDSRHAVLSVVMDHPDPGTRELYFNRFVQLRSIFDESLEEQDWVWQADGSDEHGRSIGMVYKALGGVNIFHTEDWPAIISFLKPRIMALDAFWSMVRYQFNNL